MSLNARHRQRNNVSTRLKGRLVITSAIFICLALLAVSSVALAQSGGGFSLLWWTVDGGGGSSAGGDYALSSAIGQPDAGASMSGGQFSLQGGFWPGGDVSSGPPSSGDQFVYLPFILR